MAWAAAIADCWAASRRLLVGDVGLGGLDIGLGLLERDLVIPVVDAGQDLAGPHGFVVAHQHGGDVAGDLRGDRGVVGLDVGVVGRDLEASDGPVPPAEVRGASDGDEARADEQQPANGALAGCGGGGAGRRGRGLGRGNAELAWCHQVGHRLGRRDRLLDGEDCRMLGHRSGPFRSREPLKALGIFMENYYFPK